MSLARSFTQRLRRSQPRIKTKDISLPVELIVATNVAAFEAPNVADLRANGYRLSTAWPVNLNKPMDCSSPPSIDDTPNLTDASSVASSPSPSSEKHFTFDEVKDAKHFSATDELRSIVDSLNKPLPEPEIAAELSEIDLINRSEQEQFTVVKRTAATPEPVRPATTLPQRALSTGNITSARTEKREASFPLRRPSLPSKQKSLPAISETSAATAVDQVPALPTRAPSHSKREHVRLARRRSQRNSAPCISPLGSTKIRTLDEVLDEDNHGIPQMADSNFRQLWRADCGLEPSSFPFTDVVGELEQVAAEYHGTAARMDKEMDAAYLTLHGYASFDASDYLSEIGPY